MITVDASSVARDAIRTWPMLLEPAFNLKDILLCDGLMNFLTQQLASTISDLGNTFFFLYLDSCQLLSVLVTFRIWCRGIHFSELELLYLIKSVRQFSPSIVMLDRGSGKLWAHVLSLKARVSSRYKTQSASCKTTWEVWMCISHQKKWR